MEHTTMTLALLAALGFLGDEDTALMLLADALDYYRAAKALKNEADSQESLDQALGYALCAHRKIKDMRRHFPHTRAWMSRQRKELTNWVDMIITNLKRRLAGIERGRIGHDGAAVL